TPWWTCPCCGTRAPWCCVGRCACPDVSGKGLVRRDRSTHDASRQAAPRLVRSGLRDVISLAVVTQPDTDVFGIAVQDVGVGVGVDLGEAEVVQAVDR